MKEGQSQARPAFGQRKHHRKVAADAKARSQNAVSRAVLVHAHMFKNAGTTFDWSLQRCLGEAFMDHRDDDAMRQGAGYFESLLRSQEHLQALSSHWITFPLPHIANIELHLALFLRDPIERVRSVYNFERRQQPAATPGARKAKELGFLDFVRWQLQPMPGPVIKDFHTRYCSGNYLGEDLDELYDLAVATLESTRLLGLVHRYDESMVLFEHLLQEQFPQLDLAYQHQNSSGDADCSFQQRRQSVEQELEPLMEQLLSANRRDLRLFELAEKHFERALSAVPDLQQRVRDLRSRGEILQ